MGQLVRGQALNVGGGQIGGLTECVQGTADGFLFAPTRVVLADETAF